MTRVTVTIDAKPKWRADAADQVNARFNDLAVASLHLDRARAQKRTIAASVIAGGQPTAEFQAEADLRGITPLALAQLIASKPDTAAARELDRQKLMAKIDKAASPAELQTILSQG